MLNFFKQILINWKVYKILRARKIHSEKIKEEKDLKIYRNLITQYNLIQENKSKLSKNQKNRIEKRLLKLIHSGKIEVIINK